MISGRDADTLGKELAAAGREATEPAVLVLIGGCNLAVRSIKPSTKDVDLVVRAADPRHVLEALQKAGFNPVDGYYLPGAPVDPHTMLENAEGTWVDLFLPDRLFGALNYSDSMAEREIPWMASGPLDFRLADTTSVFLLKAVTGRWRADPTRDIPDLADLVSRQLVDWEFAQAEWARQLSQHPDPARLSRLASEAMERLSDLGFRRIPWRP